MAAKGEDIPHLNLDSHNGTISGEVWLLSANREDTASKPTQERVHLRFHSHNGSVKALVVRGVQNPCPCPFTDYGSFFLVRQHLHPRTVEPRPFLNIEARAHNGSISVAIPRSFRGQLTLHTDNSRVHLSPLLSPRAASLSALNGTHTYFVGERPSSGKWHTGESEDGDEVDGVVASSKNGSIKVSYDDEDVPGVLSSLFKAMGF